MMEGRIGALEDRRTEFTQSEERKQTEKKKKVNKISGTCGIIKKKKSKIHVIKVLEKRKKVGLEKIYEEIKTEIS